MPIYKITSDGVQTSHDKTLSEERLRTIVEDSDLGVLGETLRFVDRNVAAGTGFIDTLALDAQNQLVVIEYKVKEDMDREALVQAMDYANFVSRNPDTYYRFVKDKIGLEEEQLADEIRIILLGPKFSERVISASMLVSSPIKLQRYSYSQSGSEELLYVEIVYDSSEGSVSRTPVSYDIEDKFMGNYSPMKPIFDKLLSKIQEFGSDVKPYAKKHYIAFKRTHSFAIIRNYTNRINVGMPIEEENERLLDAANWRWSRVSKYVELHTLDDIDDQLIQWLKMSYEKA